MANLKELSHKPEHLAGGHRLCAGCGAPIVVRQVLMAADDPVVISNATGCLEVGTSIYPFTSWRVPWIHSAFENSAATISGVEAMYQSLRAQGKIPADKKIKFIAFGGDGGTYDIGLQSLSGALERGHDFVYICYDNGAYMNTGIQRSSSTPLGANTTTTPVGKVKQGKEQQRKDLAVIAAAHDIPYVAQASPAYWKDLIRKVKKALETPGACFLNITAPCHRGWRSKPEETVMLAKLAVTTCYWPLYEIENRKVKINFKPKEKIELTKWLERQGRFKHLFKPENAHIIEKLQKHVDDDWDRLQRMEKLDTIKL